MSAIQLDALNFTLAGAREGFGPFLGVYLQHQGFDPARTGLAMGIAGLAGILAAAPLGALVDRLKAKRTAVIVAVAGIALGAALIVATKLLWMVAVGQVLIGVADSSLAPLIAALTLGLVGKDKYPGRVSRNEAFNHAGNAANAALAALLGYLLGLGYVALAIGIMAIATSAVLSRINPESIDHEVARGGKAGSDGTLTVLWAAKPLLLLAGTAFAFQAANGAMLPFIAQQLTSGGHDPSLTTGLMAVTAQVAMICAALTVPRLSRGVGSHWVFGAALILVVVRAGLAAWSSDWRCIAVVQVLEGLAMGLAGVAIPSLVAEMMSDTGHASAGLGAVMMTYGAGAALSPVLAGVVAQLLGYSAAFVTLGGVAALGLVVWLIGSRSVAGHQEPRKDPPGPAPHPSAGAA